ncbi:MAG: tyrosine--tRNA ligase [Lentisphaerae bacterium]|nr:tyrosine--tRNA ligase [Lentisphaerota bacterium]
MNNALDVLKERGLFEDSTSSDIGKILESPCTIYAGFDPTSASLQVGNFVTIMALAHLQRCGHRIIALVGGATGMIGDPSGKINERSLLSPEEVNRNIVGIKENLSRFLDFNDRKAPAMIVNNNDWFEGYSFVDFLRDVGKHFRLGAMLGKESVKTRLASDSGMSFAEFSYQALQAYDFLKLYDSEGCLIQIGGSDQWGNITAGIDLIRKLRGVETYGLTFPLICDSSGKKFGKSEQGAIYLSPDQTSYYDFYQFFVRVEDADVVNLLKVFTFLSMDEIAKLAETVKNEPESRLAQKRLAAELTRTVHGDIGLKTAQQASSVLFGASMAGMHAIDLLKVFADVPSTELARGNVVGSRIVDVTAASGLCKSKGEARRLIDSGGLYVNNMKVNNIDATIGEQDIIDNLLLVLRSGKKNYHLVRIIT